MRVQVIVFAPDQPPQERQLTAFQGAFELQLREPSI